MTSKRTLVISIAWAFLIVCILIVDALLPGQPSIGAASREQFRDGAELLTANPYVASTMRDFCLLYTSLLRMVSLKKMKHCLVP